MMGGLLLLVQKTRLGRAMRATAENQRVAGLMGVNPNFVISATFMIGAAMAAVAGVMMATNYGNAHFYMGFIPGLKAFTAAVLGLVAYSGVGLIGWMGAAASIVLTLLRPGLRAYAHVRDRLGRFAREVEVPREDALELRRRLLLVEQQLAALGQQIATTNYQTEQRLLAIEQRATETADQHTGLAEHVRLEVVRVEREAKNTVAQVLGDAAVVGHVRELVRFFKTA